MGRTIKISELERFDVFVFNEVNWIWPGKQGRDNIYECDSVKEGAILYIGLECNEYNQEVELLGRMEFKPEETIATHVCDNRCLGDGGHHAWPSPTTEDYYKNNQGAQ